MAQESDMFAPGWPGIPARWTSSAKSVHVADLPTTRLRRGGRVDLTFYWPEAD